MNKEIQKLINDLNKKYGNNVVKLGCDDIDVIKRIPTGSVALDIALGGGIPVGRFTQISGPLSSTKTTQAIHIIREAQKLNYVCAMIDAEGTTDRKYLESLGVDVDNLLYTRPDGLEEATQLMLDYQKSGVVNLVVWDSIEATPPTKEMETDMEDSLQMGIKQKLLASFFRKYQAGNNYLSREGKEPFTLIALNQLREKIGTMYGDPEYTPGGRAIGFTASVDIRLRKGDWIAEGKGDNKNIVGQIVKFKIEKNKTYKRMVSGEFDFYFAENSVGIPVSYNDNVKSIIVEAINWGIIQRGGAWYNLGEEKFQGLEALLKYVRDNEHIIPDLKEQIIELAKQSR